MKAVSMVVSWADTMGDIRADSTGVVLADSRDYQRAGQKVAY